MKIGFAKVEITPRVGVELAGFGAFINRYSTTIRDRLWARAMAVEQGGKKVVVVSCDSLGVMPSITKAVRERVRAKTGIPDSAIMVHCTHTHSSTNAGGYIGWGAMDEPYIEILPLRIAQACVKAVENLCEASFYYGNAPCEQIGINREYDHFGPPVEEVLRDDWRPAKPELTDTVCHVLKAEAGGRMIGFVSYFGCHPVVCCANNRQIHGDYCGVATTMLERENPGSVGLFLQGALGDVNSCVVAKPEQDSILALDIIASRYANAVRHGLAQTKPMAVDSLAADLREVAFSRKEFGLEKLRSMLAEQEAILYADTASDADYKVRMATVNALAIRKVIRMIEAGESPVLPTELQGLRIGPVSLLGSPFETFQAIKNDVRARAKSKIPLVLSVTNDTLGYAPDRVAAARGGYAADVVPMIVGTLPFARIHDELVEYLLAIDQALLA